MSDLTGFAEHCRTMATAEHKPECHTTEHVKDMWGGFYKAIHPNPDCGGCNSAEDRTLFARLAAEVDDYLSVADEPMLELS